MTSVDTFLKNLNATGLLPPGEVQAAAAKLPATQRQDCRALADTLVQQRKLTKYQANMVMQGKTRGLLLGNFVILEKLGQGGMGKVFLARPRQGPDRALALKVLPPSASSKTNAVARFKREAKAAAQLRHPNIVATHGAGEDQGVHFLVMEFVEGTDLSQQVKQNGPLPVERALDCIVQTARGLEHAHGAGVIHRDIKPGNLLVSKAGKLKILDMGLARFDDPDSADDDPADQLTQDGAIIGTIDYMSPEQAVNSKNADQRADVYGLGCTFYYLLAGKPLYGGSTPLERLVAHREKPIPDLPRASPALQAIFRRMVAKKPDERYQTMTALLADLEKQQGGSGGLAPLLAKLRRVPPTARWVAAGALGLLALVCLVLALGGGSSESNPSASATTTKQKQDISPIRPIFPPVKGGEPDPVIDLLSLVDIGQDVTRGRWTLQDGGMHLEGNNCLLELPYQPPAEYDFRIEFARQGNGVVEQILTRGGRQLKFITGWRDQVGFDRGVGRPFRDALAGTTRTVRIEPGRHAVLVQVRGDGLRAYFDNELVCQLREDSSQFSLNPNQGTRDPRALALAGFDIARGVDIYKAEVVEVSGSGIFSRPNDPPAQAAARLQRKGQGQSTPPPAVNVEDPARWQRAVNLLPLIDLEQDVLNGRWRRDDAGISSEGMPMPKLAIPYRPPEEYDFRIEFTRQNGTNGVIQVLSKANRSFAWEMGIFANRFMGFAAINGRHANNSDASVREGLNNGQLYTSIVQVRNHGLKAYVNGKLISDLPTDFQNLSMSNYWGWPARLELGIGSYQSAATYHRIEVLEVTGRGAFTRPDDPAAKAADLRRGTP